MNLPEGFSGASRTNIRDNLCVRPLAACLALPLALADLSCGSAVAATLPVANCNDAGNGSLRAALALAHSGDSIDLTALTCGKISLATGALFATTDDLTLKGPGANKLTVAGNEVTDHYYPTFGHTGAGTLQIDALRITNSRAAYAFHPLTPACISSYGSVSLNEATVTECSQGGIFARKGFAARNSTISNSYFGVFALAGDVLIESSTISGNVGYSCAGLRAGIFGTSTSSVTTVLISNSTISGNQAYYWAGPARGGAGCIYAPTTIRNSTIAFNQAGHSGGLYIRTSGDVRIDSSIIANNYDYFFPGGQDALTQARTVSGSNNVIVSPFSTILGAIGNSVDPLLLPLADNGGPTQTHALSVGSPAIDAGSNPSGLTTDQRGTPFARVVGTAPDIGAFESRPPAVYIDGSFTGSWFDPSQNGHGLMLEVLPDNRLLALWFAFNPQGTEQSWFGGVGTYNGDTAVITNVALPTGGSWIPNFDPNKIVREPWGTLTFTFTDHDHGKASFNSILGFGAGSMNLLRLTNVAEKKPALATPIGSPGAVTTDTSGNVYFSSDPNLVFKLDKQGKLTRIAGSGAAGYSGDGGPATQAQLNFPLSYPELVNDPVNFAPLVGGLAVDKNGNVFVADAYNNRVRRIDTNGIIGTVVGSGSASNAGDGGLAANAAIHWPQGVAVDSAGNLYVSTVYASLRKIATDGRISALAGDNCGPSYLGPGLCAPEQIAIDAANNVFVPDGYCRVREVRHDGSIITVAGADSAPSNGAAFTCGYSGDGGLATKAAMSAPYAVAVDNTGNLFIADTGNNCIRKVNNTGIITTVAGVCNSSSSQAGYSGDGGPAIAARLNGPHGVAVDNAGNIFAADTNNHRIRKVSADGTITTIAGSGVEKGSWSPAGNLATARVNHTATLLTNGKVLVAGGSGGTTAELYDPATRSWSSTGALTQARSQHTATLLSNGKVLVAGGGGCSPECKDFSAELYDPATGVWSATGSLQVARIGHTATLLQDGRVLIAGGYGTGYWDYGAGYVASSEIYEPSTGTWSYSPTGGLAQPRMGHQAVRLQDGKVLVVGGTNDADDGINLSTAELYDPAAGTWSAAGEMDWPRLTPVIALLQNGKVLVAGGEGFDHMTQGVHTTLSSAEIYDPASKTFTATSALVAGQQGSTASALPDGSVLVAGGYTARAPNWLSASYPAATELYHPVSAQWSAAGDLHETRAGHTATVLIDGSVLVAGGVRGSVDGSKVLSSAELYTPALTIDASFTGSWFDPAQSGHGLMVEVLADNRFLALWFAFNPEGNQQSWFGGVGTYSGNTATITDVALPTGGSWIPNFDPSKIVRNPWGTLKVTFTDCNHGRVNFVSTDGYGSGSMDLLRLTMPAGLSCP